MKEDLEVVGELGTYKLKWVYHDRFSYPKLYSVISDKRQKEYLQTYAACIGQNETDLTSKLVWTGGAEETWFMERELPGPYMERFNKLIKEYEEYKKAWDEYEHNA